MLRNVFILCSLSFLTAYCADFPNYINKCKLSDEKLNVCLKEQANKMIKYIYVDGDKNLGIPHLSGIKLPRILIAPSRDFEVDLRNCIVHGVQVLNVSELKMDNKFQTIELVLTSDNVIWECTYKATGEVLKNTFDDRGFINVTYDNIVTEYTAEYDSMETNNISYYQVKNGATRFLSLHTYFNFTHADGSDNTQANLLNSVLNKDYKDFEKEFIPNVKSVISNFVTNFMNNIFKMIPIDQLFDP